MGAIQNGGGGGRRLAPVISALLVAGVAAGIWWSATHKSGGGIGGDASMRGLVGSEKVAFFADPRVQAAFRRNRLTVTVDKAGSREIATHPSLSTMDFAFPAGEPAGAKIQQVTKVTKSLVPWYTVMTVASWTPIAKILQANGAAAPEDAHWVIPDLKRVIEMTTAGTRWKDLKASTDYAIGRTVLISTTDVRKSNSAAMFLSLASYLYNGDNVVQSDTEVQAVLPKVAPLFLKQGFQDASSAGPFEDYKLMGAGKAPLVMIYEAQFVEERIRAWRSKQPLPNADQMVLMYPKPTIYAKQVFIPLNASGERVGTLLDTDPELLALAAEYGWRTRDTAATTALWKQAGVAVPDTLNDVISPPRYEIVEGLIDGIAALQH